MTAVPFARIDKVPLGILYMLGATVMFALSSALAKWQVETNPVVEVLFFRSIAGLAVVAVLVLPRTGWGVLRTNRLLDHAGRSGTQAVAQALIIMAFGLMPLAGAVAINFSSPIFAALFSVIWLKDKIGTARGLALCTGFAGVLLVVNPGADSFTTGALYALGNAILFGSVTAAVRGMTVTESADTLTVYQMIFLTLFFSAALPFFFIWPTAHDVWIMLANGVINALGQYWWTRSLSMAPPAAVGPFYYFHLIWVIVIGFIFWGDVPTLMLVAGAAVVVVSGIFLLWHENAKKARTLEEAMKAE
jgi:drug/metabolite transporter (DMT)-like permease